MDETVINGSRATANRLHEFLQPEVVRLARCTLRLIPMDVGEHEQHDS
jgi:hypothetical protein